MNLKQLLAALPDAADQPKSPPETPTESQGAAPDLDITGISLDSRRVRPGDLFVAIKGQQVGGKLGRAGHHAPSIARGVQAPPGATIVL